MRPMMSANELVPDEPCSYPDGDAPRCQHWEHCRIAREECAAFTRYLGYGKSGSVLQANARLIRSVLHMRGQDMRAAQ